VTLHADASARVDAAHQDAVELSHRIHQNPEVGFEERLASQWLRDDLDSAGFVVQSHVCDLPTAFIATAGSGPLTIALCAEYDALPGIGHACGHNIIAATAYLAACALRPFVDDLGITLKVIGTPAEEFGGGKIMMLERGAFDGVHAALMIHPAARDCFGPLMQASSPLDVKYRGRAAHAAAWPERGINAADAITVAQVGIGLLRQHILPTDRIHGFVRHGGLAANIVPDRTDFAVTVRSGTVTELTALRTRVEACLEAGALATGCSIEIKESTPVYADMRHDHELSAIFAKNAGAVGHVEPAADGPERAAGSTDLGNVSQLIPAIHPLMKIDAEGAVNHQPAFAAHCAEPSADKLIAAGAQSLAWTIIDAATDSTQRTRLLMGGRERLLGMDN